MSELSKQYKEDRALADFLRQHRPEAPVAPEALEEKVMAAIAQEENAFSTKGVRTKEVRTKEIRTKGIRKVISFRRPLWMLPWAVAAGLAIATGADLLGAPPEPTPAELARLEAYMASTWDGVLAETEPIDPESDWFFLVEPPVE